MTAQRRIEPGCLPVPVTQRGSVPRSGDNRDHRTTGEAGVEASGGNESPPENAGAREGTYADPTRLPVLATPALSDRGPTSGSHRCAQAELGRDGYGRPKPWHVEIMDRSLGVLLAALDDGSVVTMGPCWMPEEIEFEVIE